MGYTPKLKKPATKYLNAQTASTKARIVRGIEGLPGGDVKKLQGRDEYRLVVGGYRVLYEITDRTDDEGNIIIDVKTIGPRGEVYKQ